MKKVWITSFAWVAAASAAVSLAFVAPSETQLMGRMPNLTAKSLDQQAINLPGELPGDKTLALVAFKRGQGKDIESWIEGLQLRSNPSIVWVRMPVVNDPGSESQRAAFESRLQTHLGRPTEEGKVIPVFTDQDAFLRATGLDSPEQVTAMVVNRDGQVLARVQGQYDANKAAVLRETLGLQQL